MSIFDSRRLQTVVWAAVTAVLLIMPGRVEPHTPGWIGWILAHGGDKVVHAFLFFVLVVLVFRAAPSRPSPRRTLRWIFFGALIYALILETAQQWVPRRAVDPFDLVAGAVGIVAAGVFLALGGAKTHG